MIKNLLIVYLFTISSVMAGLPPTTGKGQGDTIKPTTFNFEVPNFQATSLNGTTKLFETGNSNELVNADFEHSTVDYGWSFANGTRSSSSSALSGKKALSVALTGAVEIYQESTVNAAIKSGVQMVASLWVKSDDVSDLQLCSLKNGAEDKCTVVGGYVQGSGWRQLTVSFLGDSTSNGLKLKSTDTTGTVLVDQAYVGIGSPVVDFTPDMVYSAKISSTGVVSGESTDWINGNCSSSSGSYTCTFTSGIFTVTPNCFIQVNDVASGFGYTQNLNTSNESKVDVYTRSSAGTLTPIPFQLICQKQGADYKTSKAYVASSSDVSYQACTFSSLAWQGLGTVTNNLQCARKGQNLLIKGRFTLGTVSGSIARLPLPTNFGSLTTSSSIPSTSYASSVVFRETSSANIIYSVIQLPSVSYLNFAGQLGNATINPNNPLGGTSLWGNSETISVPEIAIPIQGWQDSSVIVGSFQGYNETPGTSRVETFSVSYGTTNATTVCSASPCSYLDQIGNAVTSVTRSGTGVYTLNTSKTYSKLKCQVGYVPAPAWGSQNVINCSNCNSASFQTVTTSPATADSYGTLLCQGIPQ